MQQVTNALAALHGRPERAIDPLAEHCGGQTLVLDSLIRTLLSQNTTDLTSIRAFKTLKQRFPTWEAVLNAPNEEIEDAIRVGGLAAIKTERMKTLLATLQQERGACCLEWLRDQPTEVVKEFLTRFKGIGPKTISCVLLFCLGRSDFPVDTHVHHICTKLLNWCPNNCSREQCYKHLNLLVPDDVKYELHVLLVQHGKKCSSCGKGAGGGGKGKRKEGGCPLVEFKNLKSGKSGDNGKSSSIGVEGEEERAEKNEGTVAGKKRPKKETGIGKVPTIKIEKRIKKEDFGDLQRGNAKILDVAVVVKKEEAT
jgi:endonuclease III